MCHFTQANVWELHIGVIPLNWEMVSPQRRVHSLSHDIRLYHRRVAVTTPLPACPIITINNYSNTNKSQQISLYRIYCSVNTKD
ncbi:hypothetical protein BV898_05222 [Hypsibius exemplaris]|uniref:Uncharacterized protein n=1 Tax=Hypsibius exemplaris TaxID=2072580 RepID=A0A1W0X0C8_HYPEX|nr:hypothetical protein BV898_05222 [Hypsibius exemplaris]